MNENACLLIRKKDGSFREFKGISFGATPSIAQIRNVEQGSGQSDHPNQANQANQADQRGFGNIVFNTGMTGYQEILTDPSYAGEIVCMTAAHLGNTGMNDQDPESKGFHCAGFVVHRLTQKASNWQSQGELDETLRAANIPAIHGVDTRSLTRFLRDEGAHTGVICYLEEVKEAKQLFSTLPTFESIDYIKRVTTKRMYRYPSETKSKSFTIVALDFGVKTSLLKNFASLGCECLVVPAWTKADWILEQKPSGVFLSNGPGNPEHASYAVETIRELLGKVPLFGVCMGHQLLGLALGAKIERMKFGHHGLNQPVQELKSKRVQIASHNHNFALSIESLPTGVSASHINLFDRTLAGIETKGKHAFSVQFHPEAAPGPQDSVGLFSQFLTEMRSFHSNSSHEGISSHV